MNGRFATQFGNVVIVDLWVTDDLVVNDTLQVGGAATFASTVTLSGDDLDVARDAAAVEIKCRNTSTTAGNAYNLISVAGSGDAYVQLSGSSNWAYGMDSSEGDAFCINAAATLATASAAVVIAPSGAVKIPNGALTCSGGDADVTRGNVGGDVKLNVENSDTTAALGTNSLIQAITRGTSGEAAFRVYVPGSSGGGYVVFGRNVTDSKFCINMGAGIGAASAALTIDDSDNVEIPNGTLTLSRATSSARSIILSNAAGPAWYAQINSLGRYVVRSTSSGGVIGFQIDTNHDILIPNGTLTCSDFLIATAKGVRTNSASASSAIGSAALTAAFGFGAATAGDGFVGLYKDVTTAALTAYGIYSDGTDWLSTAALTKQT